ncbi:MAG: diaminopimelate decarboxylase [bacterium]
MSTLSKSFRDCLYPALPQIIQQFGTPFHIYHESGIRQTLRKLKGSFPKNEFQEFFAVKALPLSAIMQIVKSEGCGFDCSSIPELRLARAAGALPEDIMFTANNPSTEELMEALSFGGCILNLDGIEFIEKVEEIGPFPELICFRLNPGNRKTGDEVNTIIGNPVDSKYGVPIEKIVEAYSLAKKAGATRFGLHTMVCSNDLNYIHLVSTYRLLLEVATKLEEELGIKLEFVNVGGGLGIPYRPGEKEFDLEAFALERSCLGEEFMRTHGYLPKLYMESGRYVTGPHGVLVNRVINIYEKYKNFVGVEIAMPALMRVGMYPATAYHHCTLLNADGLMIKEGSRPLTKVTIAGSICENCDVLGRDIEMPEPCEGDLVITHFTGAHGSAMGFNYNGRCRPQELLICKDGTVRRISRAETYDDLIARQLGLNGSEHVLELEL